MKIKLRVNWSGPGKKDQGKAGDVINVDDKVGNDLVARGHAVPVREIAVDAGPGK